MSLDFENEAHVEEIKIRNSPSISRMLDSMSQDADDEQDGSLGSKFVYNL